MERFRLPAHLISVLSEELSSSETHATMDSLFMYANAPGDPPEGSKLTKAQSWLRRINTDESCDPLEIIGFLIESYMEPPLPEKAYSWEEEPSLNEHQEKRIERLKQALARANLQYIPGARVTHISGSASRSLKDIINKLDHTSIDQEFERALRNVESSPREAVSAACNILESVFKTYIEEENLETPNKQDLQPIWKIVRDDLGLDPSKIEDRDLKEILSGMFATVSGIGALRTHASSAHGAGKRMYSLKPRHARLAVHSAHTLVTFILESWHEKREAKKINA
ncbi:MULTISPECIES: abortive infection family protein [Methylomonas]|uniref:ATP-dependent RNA helicase HrpA n=1 Tax=Methylomonas koyamae TaxID=702114 RepID=A0A177NFC0_9GAMM|nr:abortive infection family protein [Methylomonas koyamae]OAI16756.1 ATP-dependent RNA helicase HrpA [Methylomonas koyamae]